MANVIKNAKRLEAVSKMADTSFFGGIIEKDEYIRIKSKVRDLEIDNLFKAMADFCNQ